MNLSSTVAINGYGTAEGVKKEWDTRGRKPQEDTGPTFETKCIGDDCGSPKETKEPIRLPHVDNLEFMMTSDKGNQNIHFDKDTLKQVLHAALLQLESNDVEAKYLNSPLAASTDHYVSVKFRPHGTSVVEGSAE